jgi:hypothetical protein
VSTIAACNSASVIIVAWAVQVDVGQVGVIGDRATEDVVKAARGHAGGVVG